MLTSSEIEFMRNHLRLDENDSLKYPHQFSNCECAIPLNTDIGNQIHKKLNLAFSEITNSSTPMGFGDLKFDLYDGIAGAGRLVVIARSIDVGFYHPETPNILSIDLIIEDFEFGLGAVVLNDYIGVRMVSEPASQFVDFRLVGRVSPMFYNVKIPLKL